MINSAYSIHNSILLGLEEALTPLQRGSENSKILHILPVTYLTPIAILSGAFLSVIEIAYYCASFFFSKKKVDPHEDFSAVCQDSREWAKLENDVKQCTLGEDDPEFLFGIATCTYQDSKCPDSHWADWEKQNLPPEKRSEESANLFHLYKTKEGRRQVIERLQKLGVNTFRFSVEWSHIEAKRGIFSPWKMEIYKDLCKDLRDAGIAPMVTLLHFSEPKWFHEEGSFEKEENIAYFTRFAKYVYRHLTEDYDGEPLVDHFCTMNEPGVESFSRYIRGAFPPNRKMQFEKAGNFLKTALKAHTVVYDALKKIHTSAPVKIGMTHQRLKFQATNFILAPVARYLSRMVNDVVLEYFKTGKFSYKIPFFCNIQEEAKKKPKTDFIGLQYYVRPLLGFTGSTSYHEPMTRMPFREDPEGIYEAILETFDAFKVPVIVTETGISTIDEKQRERYMERSIYAVKRAREKIGKKNVKGYIPWAFTRNKEWDMGIGGDDEADMKPGDQDFGVFRLTKTEDGNIIDKNPKKGIAPLTRVAKVWKRTQKARLQRVA